MIWELSILKKLNLGEARLTTVTLQLANRSLTHPRGMIEDVLMKVDKFIFLADFMILDMEKDKEIPIILGRPFLAMGRALIDLQKGELRLRVKEEEVTFNVFNAIKHPHENYICFSIDVIKAILSSQVGQTDTLETSLLYKNSGDLEDEEVKEYLLWMGSFGPNRRKYFEALGASLSRSIPSVEKPPILEEKLLPSHVCYSYLGDSFTLLVIISYSISTLEKEKLLRVLWAQKGAISWSLADIKGIRPSICMHRILLEDNGKPAIEAQRRLNPTMKEVVRKEVLKWLDARVIYPISDSP